MDSARKGWRNRDQVQVALDFCKDEREVCAGKEESSAELGQKDTLLRGQRPCRTRGKLGLRHSLKFLSPEELLQAGPVNTALSKPVMIEVDEAPGQPSTHTKHFIV